MPAELLEKITLLRDKCREMQKHAMDAILADTSALMEAKHAAESKYLSEVKELILAEKTYINMMATQSSGQTQETWAAARR